MGLKGTGAKILLRRGMKTQPGLFERALAAFCRANEVEYEWCLPDPDGGREATFLRDVAMTRKADLVLAFFPAALMSGGTEHIVEKALDIGTPVYSWGQRSDGSFVRIGEHDPDNAWGDFLPRI